MNRHLSPAHPRLTPSRRSADRRRLRPSLDNLEDRTVLSAVASGAAADAVTAVQHHAVMVSAHVHARAALPAHHQVTGERTSHGVRLFRPSTNPGHYPVPGATAARAAQTAGHHAHAGSAVHHAVHARAHHRKGHQTTTDTSSTTTPVPTPAPTPTPTPAPTAMAAAAAAPAASAPVSSNSADPTVLTLSLNPIDLNLLGLEVQLYGQNSSSPVTVTVSAQPGSGELLGNLLTDVVSLLNVQGVSNALDTVLNSVVTLVNKSTLSVNGQSTSTTPTSTTQVLDAYIAPVNLNLLGAVVTTSPINLVIQAHSGTGLALGNIVTDLANLLNNPKGNIIKDIENGLTNLLNTLDQQFPGITPAPLPTPTTTPPGAFQVLSLTVPPIDLNLLGLILQTSTIQVNATAQSANGNLLGNLLVDLLDSVHASQSDLNTINGDLNNLLAEVVGILNATSLSIPSSVLSTLSPTLQELTSPTLINTSGGTVSPQPILNLSIASSNGTPPVDVNLLGVVVTTSNIDVQLLAQPGQGLILGNLLYNASHLLDGGLLSVLGILNNLGI